MTVSLLEGHVLDVLAPLPAGHFHTVCTSPPYWQLRAYGTEPQVWASPDRRLCASYEAGGRCVWEDAGESGTRLRNGQGSNLPGMQTEATRAVSVLNPQMGAFCVRCGAWRGELGQEPTPERYVEHLVDVFRSVRRVLRDDGTLWVNLAGCYFNDPGGQNGGVGNTLDYGAGRVSPKVMEANRQNGRQKRGRHPWLKPLDWVDVPGLFARAMQEDGWLWRSDVTWVKPSALPESVSGTRWERCRGEKVKPGETAPGYGGATKLADPTAQNNVGKVALAEWADCPGCAKCAATEGLVLRRGSGRPTKATERVLLFAKGPGYFFDQEAVREASARDWTVGGGSLLNKTGWATAAGRNDDTRNEGTHADGGSRNLRDWWVIGPEPLKDAHYAAFPSRIPERCILAGTSEWGCCPSCGAPWARVVEHRPSTRVDTSAQPGRRGALDGWRPTDDPTKGNVGLREVDAETTTLGWRPTCRCPGAAEQAPVPARVLDPFGGSGTTALAANRLGRDCTLVELKAAYTELARKRLGREPLSLFAWQGQEAMAPAGEEAAPLDTTKQEQHPTRTVRGFNQRWKTRHGAGGKEEVPV